MPCDCPSCDRVRWISEAYEKSDKSVPTSNEERMLKEIWNEDDGRGDYYKSL